VPWSKGLCSSGLLPLLARLCRVAPAPTTFMMEVLTVNTSS
jgi:hypothetical protein